MAFRNGIIISMIAFICFIVTLVFIINSKNNDLTNEEYYLRDRDFQSSIDARQRAQDLNNPILIRQKDNELRISYPTYLSLSDVTVLLARPNNKNLDKKISVDAPNYVFSKAELSNGHYDVCINYLKEGKAYEQISTLIIQ
jgi:hypothetical protein